MFEQKNELPNRITPIQPILDVLKENLIRSMSVFLLIIFFYEIVPFLMLFLLHLFVLKLLEGKGRKNAKKCVEILDRIIFGLIYLNAFKLGHNLTSFSFNCSKLFVNIINLLYICV